MNAALTELGLHIKSQIYRDHDIKLCNMRTEKDNEYGESDVLK